MPPAPPGSGSASASDPSGTASNAAGIGIGPERQQLTQPAGQRVTTDDEKRVSVGGDLFKIGTKPRNTPSESRLTRHREPRHTRLDPRKPAGQAAGEPSGHAAAMTPEGAPGGRGDDGGEDDEAGHGGETAPETTVDRQPTNTQQRKTDR